MVLALAAGRFCKADQGLSKIHTSQSALPVVEYLSYVIGGIALFYTQEEAAVLGGFLSSYLNRGSASGLVREELARFQVGLEQGCLQKAELLWAEQTLLALKPFWWEEWEDHRALMSALLKTQALLRADK